MKIIDLLIAYLSTDCLSDSFSQSEFLFQNNIKKNKNKIKVLGRGSISGVDLNFISPVLKSKFNKEIRKYFSIPMDSFVLTYIARKSIDKGAIDILKIFKNLFQKKEIFLLFAGPDESGGLVSKFINDNSHLSKNLIQLDYIDDHFKYLSMGDLNCLPSYREGFGSIIIDSSALGIPSIGYKIPGLMDSIDDGFSGFLVEEGNIDMFVKKILYFITNKNELQKFGSQSFDFCKKNFDADSINDLKYELYKKII